MAKRAVPALLLLGLLSLVGPGADSARAGGCPIPASEIEGTGNLSIQGISPCFEEAEIFVPYCSAGTVWFEYGVNGTLLGPMNTTVPCGAPTHLSIHGGFGDDTIDLSRVTRASGFTGLATPSLLDGGYGRDELVASGEPSDIRGGPDSDLILARNGVRDEIDCGEATDAVQSDQAGVDALLSCEIVDLLPAPAPPAPGSTSGPTGKRAVALRKCRKLKRRPARRRCFRHAKTLPL